MAAPEGNKYALGNNGGRPLIYEDPGALEKRVVEYFEYIEGEYEEEEEERLGTKVKLKKCIRQPESPTVTGLTLFLGFCHKSTLYDYAKRDEFSDSIKRALLVVENEYELGLRDSGCAGVIFALKNMGWEDKQTNIIREQPLLDDV